jgi:hypothetical protein
MIESPEIQSTGAIDCAVYIDDGVVVLGPKCRTADCLEPATGRAARSSRASGARWARTRRSGARDRDSH